jgi:hypothetical protein
MFSRANIGKDIYIPAVYCKDLFADEIEAEKNGESDSNFFTETYLNVTGTNFSWICPNVTSYNITSE